LIINELRTVLEKPWLFAMRALSKAPLIAIVVIPARMPMIVITIKSSTNVKPPGPPDLDAKIFLFMKGKWKSLFKKEWRYSKA
jgi:hypothetical protein